MITNSKEHQNEFEFVYLEELVAEDHLRLRGLEGATEQALLTVVVQKT